MKRFWYISERRVKYVKSGNYLWKKFDTFPNLQLFCIVRKVNKIQMQNVRAIIMEEERQNLSKEFSLQEESAVLY